MNFPKIYETTFPEHLNQGDIFTRFESDYIPEENPLVLGYMVLSFTCDLKHPANLTYITFCPVLKVKDLIETLVNKYGKKPSKKQNKKIQRNIKDVFENKKKFIFFLFPNSSFNNEPAYANIAQLYSIPVSEIATISENRFLSLKSPWRENLGFKIGHLYNRVAIDDVDDSVVEKYT